MQIYAGSLHDCEFWDIFLAAEQKKNENWHCRTSGLSSKAGKNNLQIWATWFFVFGVPEDLHPSTETRPRSNSCNFVTVWHLGNLFVYYPSWLAAEQLEILLLQTLEDGGGSFNRWLEDCWTANHQESRATLTLHYNESQLKIRSEKLNVTDWHSAVLDFKGF